MAADLYIHVTKDRDFIRNWLEIFFSNTIGSKYCIDLTSTDRYSQAGHDQAFRIVADTPSVWIGEVSWLKAALLDDFDTFVPSTIEQIQETIGENLPIVDDELITKIIGAFDTPNSTSYELTDPDKAKTFLEEHRGEYAFTVSW